MDVYLDRRLVKSDASEKDLARLLDSQTRAKIVVSPIGGQGFVFGRGNQQLSPEIIRRVGAENIVVVAGPTKIRGLKTLRVDTGSSDIDRALRGKTKVVTGYKRKKLVEAK